MKALKFLYDVVRVFVIMALGLLVGYWGAKFALAILAYLLMGP